MDEDVGIIEHDLLENPVLKTVFTDPLIVKEEFPDYYDEDLNIKQEPNVVKTVGTRNTVDVPYLQSDEEFKPENGDNETDVIFIDERMPLCCNKIILGSKPAIQCKFEMEWDNITERIYSSKVLIQKIDSYLTLSKRFCDICNILFPEMELFQAHTHEIHNQNGEKKAEIINNNKNKERCNTALKSTSIIKAKTLKCGLDTICVHCKKRFSSKQSLIKHIYTHIRADTRNNETSSIVMDKTPKNDIQIQSAQLSSESRAYNKGKNMDTVFSKNKDTFYRCVICSYYFKGVKYCVKHMQNKHMDFSTTEVKKVAFDGQCKYCPKTCSNFKAFNIHLYQRHTQKVFSKINVNPKIIIPRLETTRRQKFKHDKLQKKKSRLSSESRAFNEEVNKNTLFSTNKGTSLYRCVNCSYYFQNVKFVVRHLKNKHMDFNISEVKKVPFDGQCKYCPTRCKNWKTSNIHLLQNHTQKVFSKINLNPKILIPRLETTRRQTFKHDKLQKKKSRLSSESRAFNEEVNKNTLFSTNKSTSFYRCVNCSYYFQNVKFVVRHLKNKHMDFNISEVKKVPFDGQCKYCPTRCSNWKASNIHLLQNHTQKVFSKINLNPKILIPRLETTRRQTFNHNKIQKKKLRLSSELRAFNEEVLNKMNLSPKIIIPRLETSRKEKFNHDKIVLNKEIKIQLDPNKPKQDTSRTHQLDHVVIDFSREKKSSISVNQDGKLDDIDKYPEQHKIEDWSVLKSVLFKCNRCDIHFLTVKQTINHKEHMELLINWKCHLCKNIFKKDDEFLHTKQHIIPCEMTVIELNTCELERVLYKCTKCSIHFDEDGYLSHYKVCAHEMADSEYCTLCDILVDKCIAECHFNKHEMERLKSLDFTIINSDIILSESIEKTIINKIELSANNKACAPRGRKTKKDSDCATEKAIFRTSLTSLKMEKNNCKVFRYCKVCRTYSTRIGYKKHFKCNKIKANICKYCGLSFSRRERKVHYKFHQMWKNLKLKDFKFYSLHNGKLIVPPLPPYPKCQNCDVHFLTKKHKCPDKKYLTCHICNINLSESVFKIHMSFHSYPKVNTESFALRHIITAKEDKTSEQCFNAQLNYNLQSDYQLFDILYICIHCHITIDTYDEVVEHCQDHLCGVKIESKLCEKCNLTFESKSRHFHNGFHTTKRREMLTFDLFYFTLNDSDWLAHVFETIKESTKIDILKRSIYSNIKIRMQITQNGLMDLTVYKCCSCNTIIHPDNVMKHAETSCFKTRKYPCPMCGLPFFSYHNLQEHKLIHETHKNISLRSYRVVGFNDEKDKRDNKVLTRSNVLFLLYQCRNCNGIIDKYRRSNHKCNDFMMRCKVCQLLFLNFEYVAHCVKHEKVPWFIPENMKVVLFGQMDFKTANGLLKEIDRDTNTFEGTLVDYTFYRCTQCELCFDKFEKAMLKHATCCNDDSLKSCCPNCDLFVLKKEMIKHTKLHQRDEEFVKENINIIPYSPKFQGKFTPVENITLSKEISKGNLSEQQMIQGITEQEIEKDTTLRKRNDALKEFSNSNHEENWIQDVTEEEMDTNKTLHKRNDALKEVSREKNKEQEFIQNITDSKLIENENVIQGPQIPKDFLVRTVKLLRCVCGLHFLDNSSIEKHFVDCNPRTGRLRCSKCSLLFTPNVLFYHLITHHGDNKYDYQFVIDEIVQKKSLL